MKWLIGLIIVAIGILGGLIVAALIALSIWAEDSKNEDNSVL